MADNSSTSNLHRLAIDAALKCQWNEALNYNLQIIELEPNSVECLNRLAKAYMELGQLPQAQKIYQDVLSLDPYNTIAQKNLKKISSYKDNYNPAKNVHTPQLSATFFLSEPGVTKSVNLIKVAEPQKLLVLSPGMMVNLVAKSRSISVTDLDNNYLGVLPDDLSFHLLNLIHGGNKYKAFIQSIKSNALTILIREVYRSKKFRNQASFLEESKMTTYSSDHLTLLTDDDSTPPDDTLQEGEEIII